MTFKSAIFKYRKIIMLSLALIAVIICIVATYVTEYNNNKVEVETLFTVEETRKYKTSDEFDAYFDNFEIKLTKEIAPHKDENDNFVTGTKTFTVTTALKENVTIKKVQLKLCLAADWVGYKSNVGTSSSNMNLELENTIVINGIDTTFPMNGNLLFVNVKEPTLYVLASWSEDNIQYYTYLTFEASQYLD